MSGAVPTMFVPSFDSMMPTGDFDALIARAGVRVAWMRARTCPCIYGGGGVNGDLPYPGTADPACQQCFGVGTYWDPPSPPKVMLITFITVESTSMEPGVGTHPRLGAIMTADPLLSIPAHNPYLDNGDPHQPGDVWQAASMNDMFISIDKLSRFTAVLQVGGQTLLPYQQNLQVAASGAVAVYDPVSHAVSYPSTYTVSGPAVTLSGFPQDTAYIVEFQAAPIYVAYRPAGGEAHVRDFGQNTQAFPRRFRLQTLDLWTRQALAQQSVAPTVNIGGSAIAVASITGSSIIS